MSQHKPPTPPRLPTPRLWVWLAEDEDPILVQTVNRDLTATEETARRHKWGTFASGEMPIKIQTFLAWHAMKRTGHVSSTFESFDDAVVGIAAVEDDQEDDEDDEDAPGRPTLPDPGSG